MKKGWQTKRLSDVCEIIKGRKPVLKSIQLEGDLPYLGARVMRGSEEAEYASVKDRNSIIVEDSDTIIICDGSNSGEVFTGFRGILSSTMGKISKKAEIDDDYLRAFLASTFEVFNGAKTGAAIPHLDKEAMYRLEFPLPALPEQQHIVAILDKAFAAINKAKANAEKNLQNARELFESYLENIFANPDEGWEKKKLGEVCEKITDGTHVTPTYVSNGIPFLSVKNLTKGFIDFSNTRFISIEEHKLLTKRVRPERDDILYTKVGTTGIAKVVDVDAEFSIFVSVALLKIKHNLIFNRYLEHYLNSPIARKQAQKRTRGMANKNLVINDIKEIEISYPKSLPEQRSIVSKLDALSSETKRLEAIYRKKLADLDELKKSILQKAFSGEL